MRNKNNLCKCGCGQYVLNEYARGHCYKHKQYYKEDGVWKTKDKNKEPPPLCQCGCGEVVKYNNRDKCWNKFVLFHRKGWNHTPEAKEKVSRANKGRILSEERKKQCRTAKLGKKLSDESKERIRQAKLGEKHPAWKGGVSSLSHCIRNNAKYIKWRTDIFERDDYTCQKCNKRGGYIQAHHIKQLSKILEDNTIVNLEQAMACDELWDLNNGETLCLKCHKKETFKTQNLTGEKSMWDLSDLNPSKKFYWDETNDEWVSFRLISDEEMQKIRKKLGLKNKQKHIPNPITKRMDSVIEVNGDDDVMIKFQDAILCYQIESWNLVQPNKELITCTDENKLKLFYGSPVFSKWANKCLDDLQKELDVVKEEKIKN